MSGNPPSLDTRRKRLLWRATHRGIKEMDLILGGFVSGQISILSEPELNELEQLIDIPDQQFLSWATRQETVPAERATALMLRILKHRP